MTEVRVTRATDTKYLSRLSASFAFVIRRTIPCLRVDSEEQSFSHFYRIFNSSIVPTELVRLSAIFKLKFVLLLRMLKIRELFRIIHVLKNV